ncbi:MAG: response regulator [Treponema sp.]|jgi:putative two-component system response regulator|nr:response regulator [Treponema sp.]
MNEKRQVLMLIDDDETCLAVGREILQDKYTVYPVTSGEQAFVILEKITPDLILLDIEMPGMNGYEVIKRLKQENSTKDIPVIFLTSLSGYGNELDGLTLGAIDYVVKPFPSLLLLRRIENHLLIASQRKELARFNQCLQNMVDEQTREIKKLQNAILNTVSELVEFRDEMSGGHVERVTRYMQSMVNAMMARGLYKDEIEKWNIEVLITAAQMHDVGKIYVSEAILNKRGKVSVKEFDEIKKHPAYGSMIIDRMREMTDNHTFLDYASIIADSHHERWDGSGYPEGRSGQNIPLAGRLMAVADVYDALVSSRPYKQPMSPGEAAAELIRGSGTIFDPALIDIFKAVTGEFAQIAERQDILI